MLLFSPRFFLRCKITIFFGNSMAKYSQKKQAGLLFKILIMKACFI